jgi:hypothetical protein
MDTAMASRWASLEAKCLCVEACGHENVQQEGALGALPWGYGVDAPCVVGTNKARQHQSQDASNLLTPNLRLQNDHFYPIVVEGGLPCPQAQAGAASTGVVGTPVPVCTVDKEAVQVHGQQPLSPQLPTLNKFVIMAVPPPAPNAGAGLPAAPGQVGAANKLCMKLLLRHSALSPTLQRWGWGSPLLLMRPTLL